MVDFSIDARRDLDGLSGRWYPVIMLLHRFFIAISRAVGNHCDDEGTAPDPLVWSCLVLFPRGDGWLLLCVFVLCCLDLRLYGLLSGSIFLLLLLLRTLELGHTLLAYWFSGLLSLALCIGLLLGPILAVVVCLMLRMLVLRGLFWKKALPRIRRPGRPISVSVVPFGPGIDFWRSCRYVGALMRSLSFVFC